MLKTKDFALQVKDLSDEGTFEGYASFNGNVDSYGEIVMPGAFEKSLARHAKSKTAPLMLWQHNPDHPIGVWESLTEDSKGLFGKGRLIKGVRLADEAHLLLKAGAIQGLSIGYREVKTEPDGVVRKLIELDLLEASIVSMPANPKARVSAVKSEKFEDFARRLRDGEPPSIKEFEDILRDAGVPKSMAVAIASHGYAKAIRSDSGGKASDETLRALRDAASGFKALT